MPSNSTSPADAPEESRRVLVLLDFHSTYHRRFLEHLEKELAQYGYSVMNVVGFHLIKDALATQAETHHANQMYRLAADIDAVGVVSMSNSIGLGVEDDQVIELLAGFGDTPLVSVGVPGPGLCCVRQNNAAGMEALMQHMTRDPHRQNFVFLRGCQTNTDSNERELVFRNHLRQQGIRVNEHLLVTGNYLSKNAHAQISRLLREGHDIDAVVASNDEMAMGAIHALNQHGLRVPEDVIVSGYDDSPIAASFSPPLTTVRSPSRELARAVSQLLQQQIADMASSNSTTVATANTVSSSRAQETAQPAPVLDPIFIDTQFVARESSGDGHQDDHAVAGTRDKTAYLSNVQLFARHLKELCQIHEQDGLDQLNEPGLQIDTALPELLQHGTPGVAQLLSIIEQHGQRGDRELITVRAAQLALQRMISYKSVRAENQQGDGTLPSLIQVMSILQRLVWLFGLDYEFRNTRVQQSQDTLMVELSTCESMDFLYDRFDAFLETVGALHVNVVRYDDQLPPSRSSTLGVLEFSRLHGKRNETASSLPFPVTELLPDKLTNTLGNGQLVMHPLLAHSRSIGYLLFDAATADKISVQLIADSIAQTMRNLSQMQDLQTRAEELQASNAELARLSNFDPLTGLANRSRLLKSIRQVITKEERNGKNTLLLMVGLDSFKSINTTHSHESGDQLLCIVARRLQHASLETHVVSRLGGDRFALVFDDTSGKVTARDLANRVQAILAQPFSLQGKMLQLSCSIGLAQHPDHGDNPATLLQNAESAMYHAKHQGRNQIVEYTPDTSRQLSDDWELDQAMRRALDTGEFQVFYQPRINARSGVIDKVEALLRWFPMDAHGASGEAISPFRFITQAERSGFISEIGQFALDQSCQQWGQWREQGVELSISVNLSVKELVAYDLVERIERTIQRHKMPASALELEVTESAAMSDFSHTSEQLKRLRDLGISIAIDDFGTDYSSLNYLKQLPADILKIDRSFVRDIGAADKHSTTEAARHLPPRNTGGKSTEKSTHNTDIAIVQAITALGQSLGLTVVAEGVETEAQFDILRNIGCDELQGFLFSQAVAPDRLTELVRGWMQPGEQRA